MVHLHLHTHFSFGIGVSSPEVLAVAAAERGHRVLACTDTNGVYGAIEFQRACDAAGIRPILGAHLVTDEEETVALATDERGWGALCRAISGIHWAGEAQGHAGLSACLAADRAGLLLLSRDVTFLERVAAASGTGDLYAELVPGKERHAVLAAARRLGLSAVATNAVVMAHPEDWSRHRLVRAIHLNTTISELDGADGSARTALPPYRRTADRDAWLRPAADLTRHFPDCPEAVVATELLAERCTWRIPWGRVIPPRAADGGDALQRLRAEAYAGAERRYGTIAPVTRDRIEHELAIIGQKGFADYFLVVQDIVRHGPTHCGRGSVANSIVSYCLGITHVEPLGAGLLFERFLNPERKDPPDIDLDFPWDERDRVLAYVFQRYPRPQAAMVANHNCFRLRGALREVAKVHGRPAGEIREVTRRIPIFEDLPLETTLATPPQLQGARSAARLARLRPPGRAAGGDAAPPLAPSRRRGHRAHGAHRLRADRAGGEGARPRALRRPAADGPGHPVREGWRRRRGAGQDRPAGESLAGGDPRRHRRGAGAHRPADRLHHRRCRRGRGHAGSCSAPAAPWGSSTPSRPPRGSSAPRAGPTPSSCWCSTPASSAPPPTASSAPTSSGCTARPTSRSIRSLRDTLADTFGIMVYQEDVVNVCAVFAGMPLATADGLRKSLSKKRPAKALAGYAEEFFAGALALGREPETIRRVWEMIMSFAGYSFCKGHSASYIQVAQHSCYLRAHYPAEFMAAVLANGGGFYHPFAYVAEAMRMGLTVLPPDVNASDFRCTGRGTELRIGLQFIKGLSAEGAERILNGREGRTDSGTAAQEGGTALRRYGGTTDARSEDQRSESMTGHQRTDLPPYRRTAAPYRSLFDLQHRTGLAADDLRALIKVGALDSIADDWTRPMMLWMVDTRGGTDAPAQRRRDAGIARARDLSTMTDRRSRRTLRPPGSTTSPPPSPSFATTPPSAAAGRSTPRSASSPTPTPCTSTPTRWPASGSAAAPSCTGTSAATCCSRGCSPPPSRCTPCRTSRWSSLHLTTAMG